MKYRLPKFGTSNNKSPFAANLGNYLNKGYAVIPLVDRQKFPCIKEWQMYCDRMPTESEAQQWFKNYQREGNLGLALGQASGLVAVDVDTEDTQLLKQIDEILPPTPIKKRGRKGFTAFYRYSGQLARKFKNPIDGGMVIEILSRGNQTVLPPSIHPDTQNQYSWISEKTLLDLEPSDLPDLTNETIKEIELFVGSINKQASKISEEKPFEENTRSTSEGRNDTLKNFAIELISQRVPTDEGVGLLIKYDLENHTTPLFSDSTESGMKGDVWSNAQRFFVSILQSINRKREADNLEPFVPKSQVPKEEKSFKWPSPMGKQAYIGVIGELIDTLEPNTESDVAAIVGQFLPAFGNIIGRSAFYLTEATKQYTNLFSIIVGDTAKGRKGTSWGHIRSIVGSIDEDWRASCLTSGLSSGEGLISAVRDPIVGRDDDTGEQITAEEGVDDKRLLVVQTEFGSTLKIIERPDNILSAIIRDAWDSENLRTMTKKPMKATDPHISIIGHITKTEMTRLLTQTEVANGFGNRFLIFCSKRSKHLPHGGNVSEDALSVIKRKLQEAIRFSKNVQKLKMSYDAMRVWEQWYGSCSEELGLLGSMTARAEPQVIRIAMIYSLLDCSSTIEEKHLRAGMEIWRYCEDSCRYIFGDSVGDLIADEILRQLRLSPAGLTRSDIRDIFQRNRNRDQLDRALAVLERIGKATKVITDGAGRPTERWYATTKTI